MKRNNLSIRVAFTAIGALCGAIMIPSISYAVGAVQVNGNAVCTSNTNMSMDPAGDIVISCTSGPAVIPTSPPSCSVNVNPINIGVGQSSNISASCNPAATSYAWTMTGTAGGPTITGAGGAPTFAGAGTYLFQVTGTNSAGAGLISNSAQVVVTAVIPQPIVPGCTVTATSGTYTGNSTKLISIDRNGYAAYALPTYTQSGRTLEILSIQSTASQGDLTAEFSVSLCPGDFSSTVPDNCKVWGSVNQSGMQLYAQTSGAPLNGTCTLINNVQYYLNARAVKYDRLAPSCTPQTCYMNMQLNSYF